MKFVITYKIIYIFLLLIDISILAFDGFDNHLLFGGQDKGTLYIVFYAVCRVGYLVWNSYNLVQLYLRKLRTGVYLSENLFSVCRILMDLLALIPMTMAVALLVSPIVISFWGPLFYCVKLIGFNEIFGVTFGYIGLLVVCVGLIATEIFYMRKLDELARGKGKI